MDELIRKAGRILYQLKLKSRRFLYLRIFRNNSSIICFNLAFCLIIAFVAFFGLGYSLQTVIVYSVGITCGMLITLVIIGAQHEAKRLQKNELNSCFQFARSNMNGIRISELGFSEPDRENLNLVLNNLPPTNRINFRLISDNRISADYKKLFRILHLLIAGGIRDFKKERKEMLFRFIEKTFTLNGLEVNRASLNSRFSEWVNESEMEFSFNMETFRKILG